MIKIKNTFLLSVFLSGVLSSSLMADENENMVNSIMKLRSDVEALHTQIDDNKDSYKSQMKSLTMQKADNEAQINRQERSLKQLTLELQKTKQKILEVSNKNEDLKPMLFKALDKLESTIKVGIPFKINDRVADLTKIRRQLKNDVITPEKALSLVWASHDDLLRLTKENGLFKQQIMVEGKEKLSQIAKLGSVMLYFATPDNIFGYVIKNDSGYSYKVEKNEKKIKQIVTLFDALKKQIRTGYFTLPNALIAMESK